ncbi:MAG: hypothetical protein QME60_03350 [Verrucomicrobiota bacterium]|nr:hypothetical protein [Verrucomicrobiota bacterium]
MHKLADIARDLEAFGRLLLPRILTQACRDPNAAAFGCFDRDWWHYKIRDFPSIILQQAGYTAWLARDLPGASGQADFLAGLACGACRFWNRRAVRHHAFEEYYPWESGYPPLAFSTLAVMKLAAAGVVDKAEICRGAAVAARQLVRRFEGQAANQQVAGLAALAWLRRVHPDLVARADFDSLKVRTLALQTSEGWFEEYGGPDLGYLSVAIDSLWDLFDATGDDAYILAAGRALSFLGFAAMLSGAAGGLGMRQSRNTDYVLPYGLARFIKDRPGARDLAGALLQRLYGDVACPGHFLHAVDDRYACHYTGASVIAACLALRSLVPAAPTAAAAPAGWSGFALIDVTTTRPSRPMEKLFPESGIYFRVTPDTSLTISLNKGGILTWRRDDAWASDFGWVVRQAGTDFVNHWWSRSNWTWSREGDGWVVRGNLVPAREELGAPWTHAALRAASLLLGSRIVKRLKNRLIFAEKGSILAFERRVRVADDRARVDDVIANVPEEAVVLPAPRACRRHVASADSWHAEDAERVHNMRVEQSTKREGSRFSAATTYTFA